MHMHSCKFSSVALIFYMHADTTSYRRLGIMYLTTAFSYRRSYVTKHILFYMSIIIIGFKHTVDPENSSLDKFRIDKCLRN